MAAGESKLSARGGEESGCERAESDCGRPKATVDK